MPIFSDMLGALTLSMSSLALDASTIDQRNQNIRFALNQVIERYQEQLPEDVTIIEFEPRGAKSPINVSSTGKTCVVMLSKQPKLHRYYEYFIDQSGKVDLDNIDAMTIAAHELGHCVLGKAVWQRTALPVFKNRTSDQPLFYVSNAKPKTRSYNDNLLYAEVYSDHFSLKVLREQRPKQYAEARRRLLAIRNKRSDTDLQHNTYGFFGD